LQHAISTGLALKVPNRQPAKTVNWKLKKSKENKASRVHIIRYALLRNWISIEWVVDFPRVGHEITAECRFWIFLAAVAVAVAAKWHTSNLWPRLISISWITQLRISPEKTSNIFCRSAHRPRKWLATTKKITPEPLDSSAAT